MVQISVTPQLSPSFTVYTCWKSVTTEVIKAITMDALCGRAQSARTVVGLCALLVILLTVRSAESGGAAAGYLTPGFRPPSVPLIVVDPYLRYLATIIMRTW